MSHRNQSRRRRTYGRRQHEVRERRSRREPWSIEIESSDVVRGPGQRTSDADAHLGEWLEGSA